MSKSSSFAITAEPEFAVRIATDSIAENVAAAAPILVEFRIMFGTVDQRTAAAAAAAADVVAQS